MNNSIEKRNYHGAYGGMLFRKITHMLLKRYGNLRARKRIWDAEFRAGQWDYLERKRSVSASKDAVYHFLHQYSGNGNILDLGCGTGKTGFEMDDDKYSCYTGVDVSDVAIERAYSRCKESERSLKKNEYFAADIVNYIPQRQYRIILFRESIYYVRRFQIKKMLRHYAKHLDEDGVFIVRMCDHRRYKAITKLIEKNFKVMEKYTEGDHGTIIIVFR